MEHVVINPLPPEDEGGKVRAGPAKFSWWKRANRELPAGWIVAGLVFSGVVIVSTICVGIPALFGASGKKDRALEMGFMIVLAAYLVGWIVGILWISTGAIVALLATAAAGRKKFRRLQMIGHFVCAANVLCYFFVLWPLIRHAGR